MLKNFLIFIFPICVVFAQEQKPNIIIINCDDLGYGDLSSLGATGYQTPAIDQMARQGMLFTDFSVTNPVCTPSRAGLLTGRYPQRWGYKKGVFFPNNKNGLPPSELTIAEILKNEGYATAIIGKWHLGHKPKYLPTKQGFDYYFGIPYSNDMYHDGDMPMAKNAKILEGYTIEDYKSLSGKNLTYKKGNVFKNKVPLMKNDEVIEWPIDQSLLTKRYTEESLKFINTHSDKPFFLYLAHTMPHVPLFVSSKFDGKTQRGLYGDVIEEIDWSVDEILTFLTEKKMIKNTLVIFMSDNGPWLVKKENGGSAGSLRGGKMSTYEGGLRVPFIAWWPGKIPKNTINNNHITALDILPTVANITGAKIPKEITIDGINITKQLMGKKDKSIKRRFFISTFGSTKDQMIRIDNWKYRISTNAKNKKPLIELFNLKEDPYEKINQIKERPKKAKKMAEAFEIYIEKIQSKN